MSADNWGICPKCAKKFELAASPYGKIPEDEYLDWVEEHEDDPLEPESTLREDYELGIDEGGKFYVIYRGQCQEKGCGFLFEYRHEEQIVDKSLTL